MSARTPYPLELEDVSKAFVGVRALTDASLVCRAGEVHALVGENGAGKSTLIKIAAGALRPDSGTVRIGGKALHPATPLAARRLGLLTAYQDGSIVPELTVAENVLLSFHGARPLGVRVRRSEIERCVEPYDLPFSLDDRVSSLSPGARQLLEVVRALMHRPKVMLLDEPTAALDAGNIARLEALVAEALEHGTAILYISHRLDEVRRMAHRLTVIRDGRIQGTYQHGNWDVEDIVALMVGARTDLAFPPKPGVADDAQVVVSASGFRGDRFGPVDVTVRRGEIVGVAGAEGNGQRELVRALVGLRRGHGEVRISGELAEIQTPAAAIRRGVSFQSGDRAAESVFKELSVMDNATLSVRDQLGPVGLVLRSRQRRVFRPIASRLGIVRTSDFQPVGELSGGNQQKTVLARSLERQSPILVVDEPTAGVDARSRLDIYKVLREQAADGAAILVNSSDSSELEGLCDRVYVMSRGRVVRELAGRDVRESRIVDAFVNAGAGRGEASETESARPPRARERVVAAARSSWTPLAVLLLLTVAIGAYTATQSSVFLTEVNLANLLVLALPLSVVALGQQALLLSGGFDISVGSTMSLSVVLASFWITGDSFVGALPAILLCLAVGVAIGLANAFVVRGLGVSPIIATIATLGAIAGLAILLRPQPDGVIGLGLVNAMTKQVWFVPIAFIVVVAVALLAEAWMRTTAGGLTVRAVGLSEEAARRSGVRVERIKVGAYVTCAVVAVVAGLCLASQVGIGQSSVGEGFPFLAFTACFLGGAALTGGRGSFVGTLLGALFLALLINVTPLLGLPDATSRTVTGVLTIVAVLAYALTGDGGVRRLGRRARRLPLPAGSYAGAPAAERPISREAGTP